MKNGKLNNTEKKALWKASEILNAWIDYDEANGYEANEDAYNMACDAAGAILNFLSWVED